MSYGCIHQFVAELEYLYKLNLALETAALCIWVALPGQLDMVWNCFLVYELNLLVALAVAVVTATATLCIQMGLMMGSRRIYGL